MNTVRLPRPLQKLCKHPAKTIMSLLQLHKRFAALAALIVVVTLYLVSARPPTEIESLPGIDSKFILLMTVEKLTKHRVAT
jgi:hypothetical protein